MPIISATAGTSVAGIMETVGDIFETGMEMAGSVGTTVVGTPLLLAFCVIPLVGLGIGIFRRLLNL